MLSKKKLYNNTKFQVALQHHIKTIHFLFETYYFVMKLGTNPLYLSYKTL